MAWSFWRSKFGGLVLLLVSPFVFLFFLFRTLTLDWQLGTLAAWERADGVLPERFRRDQFDDARTEFDAEGDGGTPQQGPRGVRSSPPPIRLGEAPPLPTEEDESE